jgi:hypothetical protein
VRDRDGLQHHPVDGREQRRIRADAQGERDQDDGRPAFRLEQHPNRVGQVLKHLAILNVITSTAGKG